MEQILSVSGPAEENKTYLLPLEGESDKYINDGGVWRRRKGLGYLTVHFFPDRSLNIINHITHTFLNQKSPRIISLLSYFQANSQTLIEQHVLLVLKL